MQDNRKPPDESITASATFNRTPQVAIVSSNFRGGEEHDGTKIEGLHDPAPVDQELSQAQLDAMVEKAISLGGLRSGGLTGMIDSDEWVLILPNTGAAADPRVTLAVVSVLAGRKRGKRFTFAGGSWSAPIAAQLAPRYPHAKFESVDLACGEHLEAPLLTHPQRVYSVAQVVRRCDKIISLAPLAVDEAFGISLSVSNYLTIGRGTKGNTAAEQVLSDLFAHHPADYAVAGGTRAVEAGGRVVPFNIVIAGPNAVAVDAVGAAVMGYKPEKLPIIDRLVRDGFGTSDIDATWTRGQEVEQVRRNFKKPARWERAA